MQNISLEIKKSSKASAFTLIVAFVCVALVGLALVHVDDVAPRVGAWIETYPPPLYYIVIR